MVAPARSLWGILFGSGHAPLLYDDLRIVFCQLAYALFCIVDIIYKITFLPTEYHVIVDHIRTHLGSNFSNDAIESGVVLHELVVVRIEHDIIIGFVCNMPDKILFRRLQRLSTKEHGDASRPRDVREGL